MGEFNSNLFGELAKRALKKYKIGSNNVVAGRVYGEFDNATSQKPADEMEQQFKDAIYALILLRARNYIIGTGQDNLASGTPRKATIDLTITFDETSIFHQKKGEPKNISDQSLKRKNIAPKGRKIPSHIGFSILDEFANKVDVNGVAITSNQNDIELLIEEINDMTLPCLILNP